MSAELLLRKFDRIVAAPEELARVREFIVELAVLGRLTKQDSREEPASQLISRAVEKREQAHARTTPTGVDPKRSSPSDAPPGWAWTPLGDVIHLLSGQHLTPSEWAPYQSGGLPYITGPADFGANGLVITRQALVRKAVARKGQVLLTVKGAGVGKTAMCDLPEVAISRQLMALTPIGWSPRYLVLMTHRLAEQLKLDARSLIPGIGRDDVDAFPIPMPPVAEQDRIVAKVDELMAVCDELERALASGQDARERLLAALLHEALNGSD